ncbi:hypothetical protein [Okeania sp. SIO1I7]|uniref:hypothetical protein n=1 Tax=Okeania sp. SIO1I7 TaxID=2607772 RepID=UPI0013FC4300|nr:hypothetical protein [Okeania sp. SIO1I7]NET24926.1 hypothetical protein [Okeania sp. SIO1I7]
MVNIHAQISKSLNQSSKTSSQEAPVVPKEPTKTQTKDEKSEQSNQQEPPPSEAPPEDKNGEPSKKGNNLPSGKQIGCIWS